MVPQKLQRVDYGRTAVVQIVLVHRRCRKRSDILAEDTTSSTRPQFLASSAVRNYRVHLCAFLMGLATVFGENAGEVFLELQHVFHVDLHVGCLTLSTAGV